MSELIAVCVCRFYCNKYAFLDSVTLGCPHCGLEVEYMKVKSCYNGNDVFCIRCSEIFQAVNEPENYIFHCPGGKNAVHPHGYDCCIKCTMDIYYQTGHDDPISRLEVRMLLGYRLLFELFEYLTRFLICEQSDKKMTILGRNLKDTWYFEAYTVSFQVSEFNIV